MFFERGDEIVYISSLHTSFLNQLFIAITKLAEFPLLILITIIALLNGVGKGLVLLFTFLVNGAITQFLKIMVFTDQMRPLSFFKDKVDLNVVPGIESLHDNSLPSGHTSSAFAVLFKPVNEHFVYASFVWLRLVQRKIRLQMTALSPNRT